MAKIWITVGVGQNLCRSSIASDLILYAEAFCFVLSNFLLVLVILRILESGKQANEVVLAAYEISAWFWVNLFIDCVSTNNQQNFWTFFFGFGSLTGGKLKQKQSTAALNIVVA